MWAQSGKELFQENSLADLGSHLYGNAATRTEYLILFWAVVATNYRQFRVPWLFPKKVCVYLLARLICSFPLLNSLPPPLLPFLQSGEKKKPTLCCLWRMFAFLVVMEMKSRWQSRLGKGRMGTGTQGSPAPNLRSSSNIYPGLSHLDPRDWQSTQFYSQFSPQVLH